MVRHRSAPFGIFFVSFVATSLAVFLATFFSATLRAQNIGSHTTVRHHKEGVEEQPAEIAKAEDGIQKGDFSSAETLLKKALERDPQSNEKWAYQAWFDLGFVRNRLGRS